MLDQWTLLDNKAVIIIVRNIYQKVTNKYIKITEKSMEDPDQDG